eukprot:m.486837 g.486837  ORF g.486837 m.486837 type:complete len:453 (-) comp24634_c0_seq1:32-1390(-)
MAADLESVTSPGVRADDDMAEAFEQLQHNFRLLVREKAAIEQEFEEVLLVTQEKEQTISELEQHNQSLSVKAQRLEGEHKRSANLLESLASGTTARNPESIRRLHRRSRPSSRVYLDIGDDGHISRKIEPPPHDRDLGLLKQLQEARAEITKLRSIVNEREAALIAAHDLAEELRQKQRKSAVSAVIEEASVALIEDLDRFKQRAHAAEEECAQLRACLELETVRLQDELDETLSELESTRAERDRLAKKAARRRRRGDGGGGDDEIDEEEVLEYDYEFEEASLDGSRTRVNTRKGCTYQEQQQLFRQLMNIKLRLDEMEEAVRMEGRLKEQAIAYSAKRDATIITALERAQFGAKQAALLVEHLRQTALATAFSEDDASNGAMPDTDLTLPPAEEKPASPIRRWMNRLKGIGSGSASQEKQTPKISSPTISAPQPANEQEGKGPSTIIVQN